MGRNGLVLRCEKPEYLSCQRHPSCRQPERKSASVINGREQMMKVEAANWGGLKAQRASGRSRSLRKAVDVVDCVVKGAISVQGAAVVV
jgi:hypothetical protein